MVDLDDALRRECCIDVFRDRPTGDEVDIPLDGKSEELCLEIHRTSRRTRLDCVSGGLNQDLSRCPITVDTSCGTVLAPILPSFTMDINRIP